MADRDSRSAAGRRGRRPLARRVAVLALSIALLGHAEARALLLGPELDLVPADTLIATLQPTAITVPSFTQRRVLNPRYRPPTTAGPAMMPNARSPLRALDHFRGQVFHQTPSRPNALTLWEVGGGELYRDDRSFDVNAAGSYRVGDPELHALRVSGRHGRLSGSLMDAEAFTIGRQVLLNRLRGGVVRYIDRRNNQWVALGGVPTPIPHLEAPRLALGGIAIENVRFDEGIFSVNAFTFWRGGSPQALGVPPSSDTLPGRGAAGNFDWGVALARGWLTGHLGAQLHSLEGHRALAAEHGLEWTYRSPTFSATLSDQRGTRRLRTISTDRLPPAPRREDRWNIQSRLVDGRAEMHFTGVLRDGGDPALASRTVQLGGSGSIGKSSWYGGSDAVWDWRAVTGREERRLSLYGGGMLGGGDALLARLEHAARGHARGALSAMVDFSLAMRRGARLGIEPRVGWQDGRYDRADVTTRLSWPFGWMSSRVTASLTAGGGRDEGFQGRVREAELSISFVPRLRDRGDLQVRRFDQDRRALLEYSMAYETELERYETPGQGWFAGRDTGRVTVQVVRSGNGSGAPDILVSLDGKELRFTDADGMVRFDRVTPGVHVVAIEERSLPANHQVVQASRVFVTVERGRVTDVVRFAIARSERRTKF
ncbi:MAG TPA: hypothetical protein VFQ05_12420 [Candidatus Eisenbacteria bacterium]|nr:hypothetical protein [Candidatus Eisenbacteria bacterium]